MFLSPEFENMHVLSKLRARLWYKGPALNMERGRDGGEAPKVFCDGGGGGVVPKKSLIKRGSSIFFQQATESSTTLTNISQYLILTYFHNEQHEL